MAIDLKIANLATDGQIIQLARNEAQRVLDSDPSLISPENSRLSREMRLLFDRAVDWSMIS